MLRCRRCACCLGLTGHRSIDLRVTALRPALDSLDALSLGSSEARPRAPSLNTPAEKSVESVPRRTESPTIGTQPAQPVRRPPSPTADHRTGVRRSIAPPACRCARPRARTPDSDTSRPPPKEASARWVPVPHAPGVQPASTQAKSRPNCTSHDPLPRPKRGGDHWTERLKHSTRLPFRTCGSRLPYGASAACSNHRTLGPHTAHRASAHRPNENLSTPLMINDMYYHYHNPPRPNGLEAIQHTTILVDVRTRYDHKVEMNRRTVVGLAVNNL